MNNKLKYLKGFDYLFQDWITNDINGLYWYWYFHETWLVTLGMEANDVKGSLTLILSINEWKYLKGFD